MKPTYLLPPKFRILNYTPTSVEMMKTITKIHPLSLIKFHAILFGAVGLVCGILYSFGGLLVDTLVSIGLLDGEYFGTPGLSYGTVLAFGALFGMPLIGVAAGAALGIVESIVFMIYTKFFGGINMEVQE